jgi:hypothetical protein
MHEAANEIINGVVEAARFTQGLDRRLTDATEIARRRAKGADIVMGWHAFWQSIGADILTGLHAFWADIKPGLQIKTGWTRSGFLLSYQASPFSCSKSFRASLISRAHSFRASSISRSRSLQRFTCRLRRAASACAGRESARARPSPAREAILELIESARADAHLYDGDYALRSVADAIKAREAK